MGESKSPAFTAWRWRIMQNSIAYFPLFHKRCADFLQLFSVCCLPHFAAVWVGFGFSSMFTGPCVPQGAQDSYCKGSSMFCKRQYFLLRFWYTGCDFGKNTVRRGHKIHIEKVKNLFFPDFCRHKLIIFGMERLYFLLRFWYTGCDKNAKLKKLRRCPGWHVPGRGILP